MKINSCLFLLGLALLAPPCSAGQNTYDALVHAGLSLSAEHEHALLTAQGTDLIMAVADIQSAHISSIVEVTGAAASANPSNAAVYAHEAIVLAPHHAEAITHAVVVAAPNYSDIIHAAITQVRSIQKDDSVLAGMTDIGFL